MTNLFHKRVLKYLKWIRSEFSFELIKGTFELFIIFAFEFWQLLKQSSFIKITDKEFMNI